LCKNFIGINLILQRTNSEKLTINWLSLSIQNYFINAEWTCNTTSTMGEIFNCGGTDKLALIAEWLNLGSKLTIEIPSVHWHRDAKNMLHIGVRGIQMGSYWFWSLSDSVWESNIYSPIIWHLLACQFCMIRRLAPLCRNRQNLQSQNMRIFFFKKRSSVSSITVTFNKLKLKYKADTSKSLYMLDKYELWQTGA
jgi:hypothetical protein